MLLAHALAGTAAASSSATAFNALQGEMVICVHFEMIWEEGADEDDTVYGQCESPAGAVFYLNDVEEGGETVFPLVPAPGTVALRPSVRTSEFRKLLDLGGSHFHDACAAESPYLKVKPRRGAAVASSKDCGGGGGKHFRECGRLLRRRRQVRQRHRG